MYGEKVTQINHEYDYSNSVPEISSISYLVQYCDTLFQHLLSLIQEDEAKNERLNYNYKEYMFKKSLETGFDVSIKEKGSYTGGFSCDDYKDFVNAVQNGLLNNIDRLVINLSMSYRRGKEGSLQQHDNFFTITFKPYEITFTRKSNFSDSNMDEIENNINEVLKKFKVQNSIFCTK